MLTIYGSFPLLSTRLIRAAPYLFFPISLSFLAYSRQYATIWDVATLGSLLRASRPVRGPNTLSTGPDRDATVRNRCSRKRPSARIRAPRVAEEASIARHLYAERNLAATPDRKRNESSAVLFGRWYRSMMVSARFPSASNDASKHAAYARNIPASAKYTTEPAERKPKGYRCSLF